MEGVYATDSVVLDLWNNSGKEAFYDLIKVSDVLLDNFRAGVLKRLGADYESLKKINPRIISASIVGYGSSGPYSGYPSYDDVAQALSGMASMCGTPDGELMRPAPAYADVSAGIFCSHGIAVALYERERTGKGRKVEVNLLHSCMALMDNLFEYYFSLGKVPVPQGSKHPIMGLLGYYKTRNGYIAIGPSWPRICRVINREWMIEDPRFKDQVGRMVNRKELDDIAEEALQQADTEDWIELMRAEDLPCNPINTIDKVIEDPQVIHNKAVISMEHPEYGKIKAIGCPIKIIDAIEGENTAPPTLGEHTDDVLKTVLGYSDEKINKLKKEQEENFEEMQKHARKIA